MHEGCLALLWINHAGGTFNTFAFFKGDFFTIEDHELNQALNHNHTIVGLASDRIVDKRQIEKVGQLGKFLDLE